MEHKRHKGCRRKRRQRTSACGGVRGGRSCRGAGPVLAQGQRQGLRIHAPARLAAVEASTTYLSTTSSLIIIYHHHLSLV
jgi:hypothetical protein